MHTFVIALLLADLKVYEENKKCKKQLSFIFIAITFRSDQIKSKFPVANDYLRRANLFLCSTRRGKRQKRACFNGTENHMLISVFFLTNRGLIISDLK